MASNLFVRRIRILTFFIFLCVYAVCTSMFFSAYAESVLLEKGESGTCSWRYERINGVITLTIAPTDGVEGQLDPLFSCATGLDIGPCDSVRRWSGALSRYRKDTERIFVGKSVKAPPMCRQLFMGFSRAKAIDLSGLDTSGVANMQQMFSGCEALVSVRVGSWNVSNVGNMSDMFSGCKALTSLHVRDWDVSNVKDMRGMFSDCEALTLLNVRGWDVSNVKDMGAMFSGCEALTSLNVRGWDVSNVEDMRDMFSGCKALTSLNVRSWDVSNVRDMRDMFSGCEALTSLNVCGWDVSNVRDMSTMFLGCNALVSLDMGKWNVPNVANMQGMFALCRTLTKLDLSMRNVRPTVKMKDMFLQTRSLRDIVLGRRSLGRHFHIEKIARFEDAGCEVGTHWAEVGAGAAGSPLGKIFLSSDELIEFHNDSRMEKADTERYVRITPSLFIDFNKGSDDATGTMGSQIFPYGEEKLLSENAYKRDGYDFDGWRDEEGKSYIDKQPFENAELVSVARKTFTAQWKRKVRVSTVDANIPLIETPILTSSMPTAERGNGVSENLAGDRDTEEKSGAPEDANFGGRREEGAETGQTSEISKTGVLLFYLSEDETKGTVSRSFDELSVDAGVPRGSVVAQPNVDYKFVKWRKSTDSSWSHNEATLTRDVIESAAKKDGKFVTTTFTAHFAPEPCPFALQVLQPGIDVSSRDAYQRAAESPGDAVSSRDRDTDQGAVGSVDADASLRDRDTDQGAVGSVDTDASSQAANRSARESLGDDASLHDVDQSVAGPVNADASPHNADQSARESLGDDASPPDVDQSVAGSVNADASPHDVDQSVAGSANADALSHNADQGVAGSFDADAPPHNADQGARESLDDAISLQGADQNNEMPKADGAASVQDDKIPATGDIASQTQRGASLLGPAAGIAGVVSVVGAVSVAGVLRRHFKRKRAVK